MGQFPMRERPIPFEFSELRVGGGPSDTVMFKLSDLLACLVSSGPSYTVMFKQSDLLACLARSGPSDTVMFKLSDLLACLASSGPSYTVMFKLSDLLACLVSSGPSDTVMFKLSDLLACLASSGWGEDHQTQSCIHKGDCRPFIVEGHQVGLVRPDVMCELLRYPDIFHVQPDGVELNPAFRDYAERSAKVEAFLKECRANNLFVALKGWRDECYEVRPMFSEDSLLKMDRSATCLFGIRNYGVDINGYVMDPERGLCIWLQRRSPTKETWPGKWDNMVCTVSNAAFSFEITNLTVFTLI
uniref:DUF4743 domain-containing protein n=1 Tax=Timema shepardi TaxID=629360 RepID=A0A7R9B8F5_TIMSH|nr:unnamed protein product [Timema shepardi]